MELTRLGLYMVAAGMALIILSALGLALAPLLAHGIKAPPSTEGAFCIVLFFIPICFGTSNTPWSLVALAGIAAALAVAMLVIMLYALRWLHTPYATRPV